MSVSQTDRLERENILLHNEIARLQAEIDSIKSADNAGTVIEPDPEILRAFERMTARQHAAMQGIIHCMSNEQIAQAMHSSMVRVKVYIHALTKRLGVNRRDEIIIRVWDTYRTVGSERYLGMAGIPKDWILDENKNVDDLGDTSAQTEE